MMGGSCIYCGKILKYVSEDICPECAKLTGRCALCGDPIPEHQKVCCKCELTNIKELTNIAIEKTIHISRIAEGCGISPYSEEIKNIMDKLSLEEIKYLDQLLTKALARVTNEYRKLISDE